MNIKENYVMRNILGTNVIVNITGDGKSILKLNETASYMFEKMKEGISREDLIDMMLKEYKVDRSLLEKDYDKFCNQLIEMDVIDNG